MSDYNIDVLPKEVREGLEMARKRDKKRVSRLRVRVGNDVYPILRLSDSGFAVDRDHADHFRGLVDVYEGTQHLYQALVVASQDDGHEMRYDFKRSTAAADRPPLDYDLADDAPVGLIAKD